VEEEGEEVGDGAGLQGGSRVAKEEVFAAGAVGSSSVCVQEVVEGLRHFLIFGTKEG